jgi:hypothetical protein
MPTPASGSWMPPSQPWRSGSACPGSTRSTSATSRSCARGTSPPSQRFAAGKPAIFHQAVRGTVAEQLIGLSEAIRAYRKDDVLAAAPLPSWRAAIAYLLTLARDAGRAGHPLLVVLDEFPDLYARPTR